MSDPARKILKLPRVLVVDDEPTTIVHFSRTLRKAGFEVITAADALEGLKAYKAHAPDLTILDLHMPGMDGLDALRTIREKASAVQSPVIVCTANGAEDSLEGALKAGANDYLIKPVSARRMSEQESRYHVRQRVFERDGGCVLFGEPGVGPVRRPGHGASHREGRPGRPVHRGQLGDVVLAPHNTRWVEDNPHEAEARGLVRHWWEAS